MIRKRAGYSLTSPFSREIYQGHWVRSPWEYFVNALDITMTSPFSREICENGK
ncbi:hypothetical protein [Cylindrospermopsis raciborskii]|uniref:hypothetical protein n=1 Tax=Cylindrospermopsis raciborskii TaxID=77022 RepID=UPI001454DEDF|nr:hypothetical protein [Cylindrospermopsis raciborskii]